MYTTTISRKGQITLAKDVRDTLRLKAGNKLDMMIEGDRIIIALSKKPSTSMRGIGKGTKKIPKANAVDPIRRLRREDKEEL